MIYKKKGFTLIELLVVIAIISLLSSIVLANLRSATKKAENQAKNNLVYQYMLALELAYNDIGSYPVKWPDNWKCIGHQSGPTCLGGYLSPTDVNSPENQILNKYISGLPGGDVGFICIETNGSSCSRVGFQWGLYGVGQDCGVGFRWRSNDNGNTGCLYFIPEYTTGAYVPVDEL
jgi:prepilin-type N-terminal cleavage/methylation domain-containing protein